MQTVGQWLEALGLGKYVPVFEENEIDLEVLPDLTESDLGELGVPIGPRRKILKAARALAQPDADDAATGTAAGAPAPATYTPAHLAAKMLASRDALAGERKQVTVLFADIKGSTELVRDLDPEEADAAMTPAVQAMIDAVHRFEGTVNRVQGDGIMAMFGAPISSERHAGPAPRQS